MLRDDSNNGSGRRVSPRNVLGEPLEICSIKPMTGFYRDGCCNTGREDIGSHTVCVVMTSTFLDFSKSRGNDLSTPVPEFGFPGLKPGDNTAFICRVSTQITGKPASASALKSHCDNGPASNPTRAASTARASQFSPDGTTVALWRTGQRLAR